uniref:Uncharacterized protein n=1 Tax=Arundo donax TaxID=35708 RepID=A0A0A9B5H5_ARUDO
MFRNEDGTGRSTFICHWGKRKS